MILVDNRNKELISLKFIRNMLNLSMTDFSEICDVDRTLISKMESGTSKYNHRYKKQLLEYLGCNNITSNSSIYYDEVSEIINALLFKNISFSLTLVEKLDFELILNSMYFIDFYLVTKIIEVATFSNPIFECLESKKFEAIILKIKNPPEDTQMLIDIYFIYKNMQNSKTMKSNSITEKYNAVDSYSHFILYLDFLNRVVSLNYIKYSMHVVPLIYKYKNIHPNLRSRQIIALNRVIAWLLAPSKNNYRKLTNSYKNFIRICESTVKTTHLYSICSCNFISGNHYELFDNIANFNELDIDDTDLKFYNFCFIVSISAVKTSDHSLRYKYLTKLKNLPNKKYANHLIEIIEKYSSGKCIKRPIERQLNKVFNNERPLNILITLLEFNKLYDVTEFERVKNFLAEHPDFKLF